MTTKRILIAEDEKPLARALSLKLKAEGFDVEVVSDGEEALAVIQKDKFDLILMDIMMPKKNGFAVLEELQKANISVSVFVMSNLSQDEDMKRIESFGVKDYIVKSNTSLSEMVKKITTYLNA